MRRRSRRSFGKRSAEKRLYLVRMDERVTSRTMVLVRQDQGSLRPPVLRTCHPWRREENSILAVRSTDSALIIQRKDVDSYSVG